MNPIKRHLPTASRLLLGLIFVVFGLNGFLQFLPAAHPAPGGHRLRRGADAVGLPVPAAEGPGDRRRPDAAGRRAGPASRSPCWRPIVVNIVAFHLFLAPGGHADRRWLVLALELHLAWVYRAAFAPLFQRTAATTPRLDADRAPAQAPRVAA